VDLGNWGATEEVLWEAVGNADLLVNKAAIVMLEPFLEVAPNQFDT
jgi:carbonyl reductase 2